MPPATLLLFASLLAAETGLQNDVAVREPTRLDWRTVAATFGDVKLPADYDSQRQRYQLYVPPKYDADRAWPLIAFISPADDPYGWRFWKKVCEEHGVLFCASHRAGNNVPPPTRVRIVLDVLDDVRRRYRIDPDRTYLTGFSGGGRMSCSIALSLPEYFGGVAPIGGTNPLPEPSWIRHRLSDRFSAAWVTGETDFNRRENEVYMAPLFRDLNIRSKLWIVPKLGHAVPGPEVLGEVFRWLEEDLPRRQADRAAWPRLAVEPDEAWTDEQRTTRLWDAGEAALKDPRQTWRGVVFLQAVAQRRDAELAARAKRRLDELLADREKSRGIAEQGGADERRFILAYARAFEGFGLLNRSRGAWQQLAELHGDSAEGQQAPAEVKRLAEAIEAAKRRPYLGVNLQGETNVVAQVAPNGPAARAGIKPGDAIQKVDSQAVTDRRGLLAELATTAKPGETVALEIRRKTQTVRLTVEVQSPPRNPDDE